jgi:hypothetical protein
VGENNRKLIKLHARNIGMIKPGRYVWAGHVAGIERMKNSESNIPHKEQEIDVLVI